MRVGKSGLRKWTGFGRWFRLSIITFYETYVYSLINISLISEQFQHQRIIFNTVCYVDVLVSDITTTKPMP